MTRAIRIGTRGSQLALWQANETARKLGEAGYEPQIVTIRTTGDKRHDVSLASIGGKGLFIKELEEALERGEIDLAVHSLKDVPSIIPPQFLLAGFLERADPRDAWLHPQGLPISALREGVIGTSAPRRRAQLIAAHPGLTVRDIRGNVETRIRKMHDGEFDGIVLANAGLSRLGREREITALFDIEEMLPACGQGIVGFETLRTNAFSREAAAAITHRPTALAADCERGVLQAFGERLDCYSCVAVHATESNGSITVRAFLSDYEATTPLRIMRRGSDATTVVQEVAGALIDAGAIELLQVRA